jgi:hypothetical protein
VADLSWSGNEYLIRYADDTNIVLSRRTLEELQEAAEDQLTRIISWFESNNFVVNPSKTQMLLICGASREKRTRRGEFSIKYKDVVLSPTEHIKLLGVVIDQDLQFHQQVRQLVKKISYTTKLASLVANSVSQQTKACLLTTYILPHADYCGGLLHGIANFQFKKIENLLHRSCKRLSVNIKEGTTAIHNLRLRQIIRVLCFFHEIVHDNSSPLLNQTIEKINYQSTRSSMAVRLPLTRTSSMKHSLTKRCALCWNKLPAQLNESKLCAVTLTFRKALYKHSDVTINTWNACIDV